MIRRIPDLLQPSERNRKARHPRSSRERTRRNSERKSCSSSSSSRKSLAETEKRKTRRHGAGQSYCTMFTSSAAPSDHGRGAHARARDPRPPPLSSSNRPSNPPLTRCRAIACSPHPPHLSPRFAAASRSS